jgi:hypothetical protein
MLISRALIGVFARYAQADYRRFVKVLLVYRGIDEMFKDIAM